MSLKSKMSVARPGSTSLRATVPEGIVAFLKLKDGDSIGWKMEIIDDKRVAIVEKVTTPEEEMAKIRLKYVLPEEKKKIE